MKFMWITFVKMQYSSELFNRTTTVDNYRCVDGYKLVHLDKVCILLIHNLSTHQWYVDN